MSPRRRARAFSPRGESRSLTMAHTPASDHLSGVSHSNDNETDRTAAALIKRHGERVRQRIVDQMIVAIRAHDLALAKRWDEVGQAVDRKLAA